MPLSVETQVPEGIIRPVISPLVLLIDWYWYHYYSTDMELGIHDGGSGLRLNDGLFVKL